MKDAHFYLEEIWRNAGPIAEICEMARKGKNINYGRYKKIVAKVKWDEITEEHLMRVDQVICAKNATRASLNEFMREVKGFESYLPEIGDKVIVKKNNQQKGIVNGMFATMTATVDPIKQVNGSSGYFIGSITTEMSTDVNNAQFNLTPFDEEAYEKVRNKHRLYEYDKIEYGYAITCHSAQGSQFARPLVVDEPFGSADDRRRWRYTAYSRAQQRLIIAV